MTDTRKKIEREIKDIRNAFTDELKKCHYKGKDYAKMTQKMKKWLNLTERNKWDYFFLFCTRYIAETEKKATMIMKKFKIHNHLTAWIACRVACL